ncbi:MAG TPA: universal stress protein [Streptosporangiaceae bacterium]|nr:universal stress protein [Streptosporangiaceae bacterium]
MTQGGRGGERRIVVGVDGSSSSRAALAWAVGQARATGGVLDVVTAWEVPLAIRDPWPPGLTTDFEGLAKQAQAQALESLSGQTDQVEIRSRVVEGNAADVLLDAAAGADLLVVGSHGHGGFMRALLGSVGLHCVHHATSPVVVIREGEQAPG